MNVAQETGFRTTPMRYFAITACAGWTLIFGALCAISFYNETLQVEERARLIARTLYERNARSAMLFGSVRIINANGDTSAGKPAPVITANDSSSVTRHSSLLQAAAAVESSPSAIDAPLPITAKIISLDSSRVRFAYDRWEANALASLKGSRSEYWTIVGTRDGSELRYAGALRDAAACRQCHARADFQAGKLRGAMSVTVPLAPIWLRDSDHRTVTMALLGSLWFIGLGGIFVMHRGLTQRIKERDEAREQALRISREKSVAESALAVSAEQLLRTEHRLQDEKLRTEIAGNLHDDIGATLSSTSIFSELLGKELMNGGSPRAIKLLSRIKYNLLAAQLNMHDIVWAINPENDSLDSLLLKLQEYASDILDANGVTLHCTIAPVEKPRTVAMNVRKELLLIFKETLNNIVRHAKAHAVTLTIVYAEPTLSVSVRDDGRGIGEPRTSEGNGLKNMKQRAEKLSGSVRIESNPGKGTLVQIRLPLA